MLANGEVKRDGFGLLDIPLPRSQLSHLSAKQSSANRRPTGLSTCESNSSFQTPKEIAPLTRVRAASSPLAIVHSASEHFSASSIIAR